MKARQGHFWAPSSPDMNPLDFFLWGVLKDKVYKPMPTTMVELQNRITQEFQSIPMETVQKAVLAMKGRAQKLVISEGRGFEGKKLRL